MGQPHFAEVSGGRGGLGFYFAFFFRVMTFMGKWLGGFYKPTRADAFYNMTYAERKKLIAKRKNTNRKKFTELKDKYDFFNSEEWFTLRYQALLKYGRRCMCCGATPKNGVKLHVDHIKPRSKYPDLSLDINNLQVLCEACNKGKGAWDQTDFRKGKP